MFKNSRGVSKSVASPTPHEDLPQQLTTSLLHLGAADVSMLDDWLDELLTAAVSVSSDAEVRKVLLAAGPGPLTGSLAEIAGEVLAVVRSNLGDLQTSIEILESCQDALDPH